MGEFLDLIYAGLVIYFIYKLITGLIMPVAKVSSEMKNKMREMHEQQNQNRAQQNNSSFAQPQKAKPAPKDDYIDFEEVK